MRAGTLRHRLVIQTKTSTGDGMGGVTESWNDEREVMAAIVPVKSDEKMVAQQMGQEITHQIHMRYVSGLTADKRLRYFDSTTYFDIHSVINPDYRNRNLQIIAKENV